MTSVQNDRDFIKHVITANVPDGILGDAIDWIKANLNPEDVFEDRELEKWATGNGFILEKDIQK